MNFDFTRLAVADDLEADWFFLDDPRDQAAHVGDRLHSFALNFLEAVTGLQAVFLRGASREHRCNRDYAVLLRQSDAEEAPRLHRVIHLLTQERRRQLET